VLIKDGEHPFHRLRYRVVGGEVVAAEERVEHRSGDQVLGEHFDGITPGDAVVEVAAQTLKEPVELGDDPEIAALRQGVDAGDVTLRDVGDVPGPLLPVLAGADLGDDPRVDRVPPFLQRGEGQPERALGAALAVPAAGRAGLGDADDVELAVAAAGQLDPVDHGVEPLVVRARRLQDLPHGGIPLVVPQGDFGCHPVGDADGQDDVAELLVPGRVLAHDPADGLDDVDDRLAGREEHHRIQGGDVDALGEAAGVGQDAAYPIGQVCLEPVQSGVALERVEGAVDVLDLTAQRGPAGRVVEVVRGGIPLHHLGEEGLDAFGVLDRAGEGDRAAHRGRVAFEGVLACAALGQAVPAADDLGGVVEPKLAGLVRELDLEGLGDGLLVDGEDEDLVVGEQVGGHGLTEAEAVELRPVDGLVVHGSQDGVNLAGLGLGRVVVDARGRRHVEPLGAAEVTVVVDPDEGGLVVPGQGRARRAMSLVADDEVVCRQLPLPLRLSDDVDGLVGREDDRHRLGLGQGLGQTRLKDREVGRRRQGEIHGGDVLVDGFGADRSLLVRADSQRSEWHLGGGGPLPQRLGEQADRRDEEQDAAARADDPLCQPQRGERLAGAAGHDQLAAVAGGEPGLDVGDGLDLVWAQLVLRRRGQHVRPGQPKPRPIHGRGLQLGHPDPAHRNLLALDRVLGVRVPPVRRRDDDPLGEPLLARGGQERVDRVLVHRRTRPEELALDRDVAARTLVDRHQVDARVVLPTATRPLLPQPHVAELIGIHRIGLQICRDEALEPAPLVSLRRRGLAQLLENVVDRRRHAADPALCRPEVR